MHVKVYAGHPDATMRYLVLCWDSRVLATLSSNGGRGYLGGCCIREDDKQRARKCPECDMFSAVHDKQSDGHIFDQGTPP